MAEVSGELIDVRSFTMLMSYGASYLKHNQRLYDRLVAILDTQLKDAFNNMRMKEADDDDEQAKPDTVHLKVKKLVKEKNNSTMGIDE